MSGWKFNGNYRDRDQISEFWDAYLRRMAELEAADRYPYNDDFVGHLGGPFASRGDEDSAIYLCQRERHIREMQRTVDEFRERGGVNVEAGVRYSEVLEFGFYSAGTGLRHHSDIRVVAVPGRTGLYGMRKGARTKGFQLTRSGRVLGIPEAGRRKKAS